MLVMRSDQCQKMRSPANIRPHRTRSIQSESRRGRIWASLRASTAIHSQKIGSARNKRWKAVAVGPSSEMRTKMPEKEMSTAPSSNTGNARRAARGLAGRAMSASWEMLAAVMP